MSRALVMADCDVVLGDGRTGALTTCSSFTMCSLGALCFIFHFLVAFVFCNGSPSHLPIVCFIRVRFTTFFFEGLVWSNSNKEQKSIAFLKPHFSTCALKGTFFFGSPKDTQGKVRFSSADLPYCDQVVGCSIPPAACHL